MSRQSRLTDNNNDESTSHDDGNIPPKRDMPFTILADTDSDTWRRNPLWPILVETARNHPLYPGLIGYVRDKVLPDNPDISAKAVAARLAIPLGQAMVILSDLREETDTVTDRR